MEKKEKKRRFITIELCPCMNDKDEARFKEWIQDGIRDMRHASENSAVMLPKKFIRTKFENDSEIIVVSNKIIKP